MRGFRRAHLYIIPVCAYAYYHITVGHIISSIYIYCWFAADRTAVNEIRIYNIFLASISDFVPFSRV